MKKIFFVIVVQVLFLTMNSKAGTIKDDDINSDSLIESSFDALNDISLIKLKIPVNGFVKVYITDESKNMIEVLVDGELNEGQYNIYYKASEKSAGRKYNCHLEVYPNGSNVLMYSDKIKID